MSLLYADDGAGAGAVAEDLPVLENSASVVGDLGAIAASAVAGGEVASLDRTWLFVGVFSCGVID